MALPKRRHSIGRGRRRRTHWKINLSQAITCPKCKQSILPHHLCPFCGYYKGKEILKIETAEERRIRKEKKREKKQ